MALERDRGRDVMVVEAVLAQNPERGATVNEIATELGIDQSGASRLASEAEQRGYLKKSESAGDGRRRVLKATDTGLDLVEAAHQWQEQTFADMTTGWSDDERETFHRLMRSLMSYGKDIRVP